MKETFYTIPINEAFEGSRVCPFCEIEKELDAEAIEHALGPSVMEPHFRIITNESGFCKHHYSKLKVQGKALPLALLMQSQSNVQNEKIKKEFFKGLKSAAAGKGWFKKKSIKDTALAWAGEIEKFTASCVICDRVENRMGKIFGNTVYMWKTQPEFKELFGNKTFCLPHFTKIIKSAAKGLGEKDFKLFFDELARNQIKALEGIYCEISEFIKLYDHRSGGDAPPEIKSALVRCIQLYSGFSPDSKP